MRWKPFHYRPMIEPLGARILPALSTTFTGGTLTITGDDRDDVAVLNTDKGGNILLNGSPITDGPTVDNTGSLRVIGGRGHDPARCFQGHEFQGCRVVGQRR